ncbi:FG-GAP repeat-containing protein [Candidatus Electrothrix aarhusensis]|uniref:FG-GAP repeat-containing protein n=1 Tax=Candidatus Electrothrix aarhusensis TaxID=1859131 RepID=A0A3S3SKH6_9BACT|nr:FG-GAP repeat-containing protein [Candidatus Electrothrix aarhusensis]
MKTPLRYCLTLIALLVLAAGPTYALEMEQVQKLLAADGAAYDYFGSSVSISGDTALVGAAYDDDNGSDSGSAYVFVRSGDTWTLQQKLTANDGAVGEWFGISVSISGDTALVGTSRDDDNGLDSGSVYVFVRSGNTWSQQQKLTADDGVARESFGYSVSLSGDTAFVAVPGGNNGLGSVYVFVRTGSIWSQQQKLTTDDCFGRLVSISGDTALVGAPYYHDMVCPGLRSAAYVFVRSGSTWNMKQKLTADDAADAYFGESVSISDDTVLVGAYDSYSGSDSGSAYVFVRNGDTWALQQKLTAADGATDDRFGLGVSVASDTAVIGARGSAYVFVRSGTSWIQEDKLTGAGSFGHSVSLDGVTAVIGGSESAYIFSTGNTAPVADAGQDQSAMQGEEVCFDGSDSSDADGDPLSYLWTLNAWPAGSAAELDDPTAEAPCLIADLPGTYRVSLVINDGTLDSEADTAEAVVLSFHDAVVQLIEEAEAVIDGLDPDVFKRRWHKRLLLSYLFRTNHFMTRKRYRASLWRLRMIVRTFNGCVGSGKPDRRDWIQDCDAQEQVYPLIMNAIGFLKENL